MVLHLQAALIGAVACMTACLAYCGYSVLSPELQRRRIDAARKSRFKAYALRVSGRAACLGAVGVGVACDIALNYPLFLASMPPDTASSSA